MTFQKDKPSVNNCTFLIIELCVDGESRTRFDCGYLTFRNLGKGLLKLGVADFCNKICKVYQKMIQHPIQQRDIVTEKLNTSDKYAGGVHFFTLHEQI